MFYERKVDSFQRLMKEVSQLDSDAGIRLFATFEGKKCFVFVSKSINGYAIMVYSVSRTAKPAPSRRLWSGELEGPGEVGSFLKSVIRGQVQAFVY
jgi:hypothetical protein